MRRKINFLILVLVIGCFAAPLSEAALPTFDAVNAALNEVRNTILDTKWAQDLALAAERLSELRSQTLELFRFHSGFDEILDSLVGDLPDLLDAGSGGLWEVFTDAGLVTPEIEIFQTANEPEDIRVALEELTGEIPDTDQRPYLVFDEMQVVGAFHLAEQIREAGKTTREAADRIAEQAKEASPKGAERLQAQATAQLMVLQQQNLEASAKALELKATQVEQVAREEKRFERERVKFIEDAVAYGQNIIQLFTGV